MTLLYFAELCPQAFSFLVERFGFEGPVVEYLGPEVIVRYRRGPYMVKIVMESGMAPLVEIFYPAAETGEPEIPWAREGGVPRARRIIVQDKRTAPEWPKEEREYLRSLASHFLGTEGDRLQRWSQE